MTIIATQETPEKQVVPGYWARFIHSEHMTLAFWRVEAGAALSEHAHPHEQITTLLEGDFEITVAGKISRLKPGMAVIIPGNEKHQGKALTACRLIDAFYPVREEYRDK